MTSEEKNWHKLKAKLVAEYQSLVGSYEESISANKSRYRYRASCVAEALRCMRLEEKKEKTMSDRWDTLQKCAYWRHETLSVMSIDKQDYKQWGKILKLLRKYNK